MIGDLVGKREAAATVIDREELVYEISLSLHV